MAQWLPVVNLVLLALLTAGGLMTKRSLKYQLTLLGRKTDAIEGLSKRQSVA